MEEEYTLEESSLSWACRCRQEKGSEEEEVSSSRASTYVCLKGLEREEGKVSMVARRKEEEEGWACLAIREEERRKEERGEEGGEEGRGSLL